MHRCCIAEASRGADLCPSFGSRLRLLRLRALLAHAHGDATMYASFRDRYRDMAKTLEFEGHIASADAMP
jgi:hypothetical protein